MKKMNRGVLLMFLGLFVWPLRLVAIEGLRISVLCPDVVLSWPSKTGETYIVQYRAALNTNDQWVTLTNSLPALLNTNWTTFVHTNVSECPQSASGGGESGGGGAPSPYSSESTTSETDKPALTPEERAAQRDVLLRDAQAYLEWLMTQLQESATLAQSNRAWRKANGVTTMQSSGSDTGDTFSAESESSSSTTAGFYRVVRTGVTLFGITNGQVFSGVVSVPIEIGVASANNLITDVGLAPLASQETDDSRPAGVDLYVVNATNRVPSLLWDTHRSTNGTYVLQAAVTLNGDNLIIGVPLTVIVSNQIQMPKIPDVIVSGLPIYAVIDQPSASYTITIQDAQGQVVRTLSGQAVNYIVNTSWNGRDANGNNVLVNHSYVDVTVSYNPSYTFRVWVFFEDDFVDGKWLIAYQKGLYTGVNETAFENAMGQVATTAADEGLAYDPYLQIQTANGFADWTTLTNTLKAEDCRNFYYWGHGSSTSLGFSQSNTNFGLRAWQVGGALGNVLSTNFIEIRHAFRFVWLDGCHTGTKSSLWPRTFGITPLQLDAADFAGIGAARRAFLGWKEYITTTFFDNSRFTFVENFFQNWIHRHPADFEKKVLGWRFGPATRQG